MKKKIIKLGDFKIEKKNFTSIKNLFKKKKKKKKIDPGIYDDISICPSKDKNESKRLFTISFKILKHFGEFNQFKMGLKSINEKFVHTDN